jgi:hypothetical protein
MTIFSAINPKATSGENCFMYRYQSYQPSLLSGGNTDKRWHFNNGRGDWLGQGVTNGANTGWQVITGVIGGKLHNSSSDVVGSKLFVNSSLVGTSTYKQSLNTYKEYNYLFHKQGSAWFSGDVGEGKTNNKNDSTK